MFRLRITRYFILALVAGLLLPAGLTSASIMTVSTADWDSVSAGSAPIHLPTLPEEGVYDLRAVPGCSLATAAGIHRLRVAGSRKDQNQLMLDLRGRIGFRCSPLLLV